MNRHLHFLKQAIISLVLSLGLLVTTAPTSYAVNVFGGQADQSVDGSKVVTNQNKGGSDLPTTIKEVISTIFVILGILAVIMIIIGGIRYTTSNGDPGQIKNAKNTIMYAVIGLILAILSYAIVNFVLSVFGK